MGNCNSNSPANQACKGCGRFPPGKNCDCTAGLDKICGRCDPSWLRQIPGTYDAQYNSWMAANPEPVKPALLELIPISFQIECNVCNQSITQGQITAGSVTQGDIDQTMNCFNKQIDAAKVAADQAAAAAAAAAKAAPTPVTQAAAATAADTQKQVDAIAAATAATPPPAVVNAASVAAISQSTTPPSSTLMMIFIMGFLLIVLVIVATVYHYSGPQQTAQPVYQR